MTANIQKKKKVFWLCYFPTTEEASLWLLFHIEFIAYSPQPLHHPWEIWFLWEPKIDVLRRQLPQHFLAELWGYSLTREGGVHLTTSVHLVTLSWALYSSGHPRKKQLAQDPIPFQKNKNTYSRSWGWSSSAGCHIVSLNWGALVMKWIPTQKETMKNWYRN